MSAHTAHIESALSPEHAMLTDQIGNEVYSSHYAERKAYRFVIGCGTVLLCGSFWLNFSLAHRPIANRYIRIDEMGRAQAIQYTDLNYSPREGEVRTYLTDWVNYRFTINREVIAKKYPLNYYFLSGPLASQLMASDNQTHLISQVTAGQVESGDGPSTKRDHHLYVGRGGSGRPCRAWNRLADTRQALLRTDLASTPHGALAAVGDVLPEPQAGQRSGKDLSAV